MIGDYAAVRRWMQTAIMNGLRLDMNLAGSPSAANYGNQSMANSIVASQPVHSQIMAGSYMGQKFDFIAGKCRRTKRTIADHLGRATIWRNEQITVSLTRTWQDGDEELGSAVFASRFFFVTDRGNLLECLAEKFDAEADYDGRDLTPTIISMDFAAFGLTYPGHLDPCDLAQRESSVTDAVIAAMYSDWLEENNWQERAKDIREKWGI